jgi:hypothetical protein
VGLKLNVSHQLRAYVEVNLLGDNIGIIKKKYILLSRHQNVGQDRYIK